MNHSSILGLINNAALLLALCLLYDMLGFSLRKRKNWIQQVVTAVMLGAIGLAIMSNPWDFGQGVIFDTRSVLLVVSGFFFGAIPITVAMLFTGIYRFLSGGAGMWTGIAVILTSGIIGLLWRYLRPGKDQKPSSGELYLLGIVVHLVMLAWFFLLPWSLAINVLGKISLPVMLIYPLATVILGKLLVMSEQRRQSEEELKKSEERYRELVENANSIILRWDRDGRISFFNEYAQHFFGYSAEEIVGKNVVGTIVPESDSDGIDLGKMVGEIALHPENFVANENENMLRDGRRVRIFWTNKPIFNAAGEMVEILCVGNDVTRQRQAEESAREATLRMQEVVRATNVGFWEWDLATNQTRFSAQWKRQIGYEEHEIVDSFAEWESRVHPDDLPTTIARIQAAIQAREPEYKVEFRFRHRDGSYRWILALSSVIVGKNGEAVQVMGSHIDITERRHWEDKLKESEERFKALHNASFGGIAIHDDGVILECNQGLSEISGFTQEELIGMDSLLLIAPHSRELVLENIKTGYEKAYEVPGLRKNGEEYPLRLESRNIPYKGKMMRCVELRDISEQKRYEEERDRLQAQLLQSQKIESVGRLAGGVAHDFNNMLGVIMGHAELGQESLDPSAPAYADLEEIRKAAERSANLTRQLLAFARKQTIAPRVLDLNDAVAGMLKMVRRLIGEDIDLTWLPGSRLWPVKVDPSQLDQILANLCVNARDAIADVGKISIETADVRFDKAYCDDHPGFLPGEYVLLTVSDNGCGMSRETIPHIYEPFFTTKEQGKGTGLGLATVYGIVKQNCGFINVYSELGVGTSFKIYLPKYENSAEEGNEITPPDAVMGGGETILLVEDEPAIMNMTRVMLERLGYTVLTAGTPSDAIHLAECFSDRIDLLLTDVIMPEMNGRDLARNLLALHPQMSPLFMSGYTANVIAHHGVLDKGVQFIEKPFSKKDLSMKIREVLNINSHRQDLSN